MEAIVAWLLEDAERKPLYVVFEDLHWADPSTLELVSILVRRGEAARLLTLLSFRPEFELPWKPSRVGPEDGAGSARPRPRSTPWSPT